MIVSLGVIIYCLCKLGHNIIDASSCRRLLSWLGTTCVIISLWKNYYLMTRPVTWKTEKLLVASTIEYSYLNFWFHPQFGVFLSQVFVFHPHFGIFLPPSLWISSPVWLVFSSPQVFGFHPHFGVFLPQVFIFHPHFSVFLPQGFGFHP